MRVPEFARRGASLGVPIRHGRGETLNARAIQAGLGAEAVHRRDPAGAAPAFIVNGRFMSQPVTGVQRYALEITRELDIVLRASRRPAQLMVASDASPGLDLGWLSTRTITPLRGHAWEQFVLPREADVPLLNLCNLAPLLGHRNVVCIHDANVFLTSGSYSGVFRQGYRILQPRIARRACRVTTVSHDAARKIVIHLGIPAANIDVIPNGHEHALRWRPEQSSLLSAVRQFRRYVLVVGSLAPHKNVGRIFALADTLDRLGVDIVVVGSTQGPFLRVPSADAKNIRFMGRVSDDDLACLLDDALCLLFPSRQEGFGLPVVEAMARGCPVVCSSASCLPEVCGGAALLADPETDEDWSSHVASLVQSRDLRADLVGRGLENVRRFSWRASASAYANLMDEVTPSM